VVRVEIQEELEPVWRSVLERELNLNLAPVRRRLRTARVRFVGTVLPDNQGRGYRCVFTGKGLRGEAYFAEADSVDGRTAIHGTLLRVRRDLLRRCCNFRGPGRP
jgi:hypothetical protein